MPNFVTFYKKKMEVISCEEAPVAEPTQGSSRMGYCEVCAFHEAKYSCPRCEVKTCSLKCNKIHKLELECNGQRDKTKFVPLNKFSNLDLSNDYKLMEEINNNLHTFRKKFGKRFNNNTHNLPHRLIKLQSSAKTRKTNLKFLPSTFGKRRNNTTSFKNGAIFWHIEWVFINAENLVMKDTQVHENTKICSILHKYMLKQEDPVIQEKLQFYQAVDLPGVRCFLKAEQKGPNKFYEIDASLTVQECLRNKLIIEYPTIYLVLKDHGPAFEVIDSDDESGGQTSGSQVIDSIIKKAESEESLLKSLKNLLFVEGDDEMSEEESNVQ